MQAKLRPLILWAVTIVILITGSQLYAEAAPSQTIDFVEALHRAEERSPDYDIAKQGERTSNLTFKNAWSALLPSADIEAQHFYSRGGTSVFSTTTASGSLSTPLPSNWSDNLGVTITENLYDNGDTWRQVKIGDANREIGRLTAQKGLQQLYLNVAKAYYSYSLAILTIDLQKQEIDTLRKEFETIQGRYRQGVNSNRDFLRIKAQLQRAEIDFASQQTNAEETLQSLRLAIGEKEAVGFIPFRPVEGQLDSLEFPIVSADDTFDFRMARLQNEISDLKYRTVARQEWPRLSLKGSYSYNDPQYIGPAIAGETPYWNLQAALVLDYSIWDWGIRRRTAEIADNQRHIERDQQDNVRITVLQDLNKLNAQLTFLKKSYAESKQILKDENDVYTSLNRGYRDGTVSYLDLITALQDLFSSRSQFLTLQYNLLSARATLAFYQGNLNDVLLSR